MLGLATNTHSQKSSPIEASIVDSRTSIFFAMAAVNSNMNKFATWHRHKITKYFNFPAELYFCFIVTQI